MQSDLLNKIEADLHVVREEINHFPPTFVIKWLAKELKGKHNIVDVYLSMDERQEIKYFPHQKIPQQAIKIISQTPLLSARVIFAADYYKIQKQKNALSAIFSEENEIYKKSNHLKDLKGEYGEYRKKYLVDIGFLTRQNCKLYQGIQTCLENYNYYTTEKIKKLHEKREDYNFLETRHDYIQWMFPNHYRSMFNSQSQPMGYLQVEIFRKSRKLGLLILKSAEIFFDFLGLQLQLNNKFKLISQERLHLALNIHCHNHLRLRRLLACLSITGFRQIALEFIEFLKHIIEQQPRFQKLKRVFKNQWQIYGDKDKKRALQLCFHPQSDFPENHFVCKKIFAQQLKEEAEEKKQEMNEQIVESVEMNSRSIATNKKELFKSFHSEDSFYCSIENPCFSTGESQSQPKLGTTSTKDSQAKPEMHQQH